VDAEQNATAEILERLRLGEDASVLIRNDYPSIREGIMNRNSGCAHRNVIRRLGPT
jgi:hypothetical protein